MKKNIQSSIKSLPLTFFFIIFFSFLSFGQTIIISEVTDPGDLANAKFVELYNATTVPVDISGWQIRRYANGGTSPTNATIPASTTLASSSSYTLAFNQTDFNSAYIINPDQVSSAISGNGDDVYELYDGSSVIDIYGEVGVDGSGKIWEYTNSVATRNSNICSGNATWTQTEWTIISTGNVADATPGTHTALCIASPLLTTSTTTLTGYSYILGSGPSGSQNFDLSGVNLDGTQVTVSAPANYEVSTDNTSFSTSVNISYTAPTLNTTAIYIRLKSGLAVGSYNGENVTCNDNGTASDITISNDGEVLEPVISASPSSLAGYSYIFGSGPSSSQSFDLSGTNLNGTQVTVSAPTNYEVSTDNTSFSASVNVSYTAPTLNATPVYIRLKSGLAIGTYNSENVTCNDNGSAANITISNDGEVTDVPSTGCATDLIISEYIEGSSNNKYIEIYNATGAGIDLTDYDIVLYSNGSSSVSSTIALSGTLADDGIYIIENIGESLGVSADLSTGSLGFNGDDVVALRNNSTNIDVVGIIGSTAEPGANITLTRKSSVTSPTISYNTSEWDSYAEDEISYLGTHAMLCTCAAPTTQAQDITFPSIFSTQLGVSWTNGDGSKRIVIMNTSNSFTNPTDGIDPAANTAYGGSGEQVVYNGTGNAVTVTNLTANTTYWFRVYEANCTGTSIMYYTVTASDNPLSTSTNSVAPPAGPTEFQPGDLIVVGFDTYIGNGGADVITVASFVDIGPGTTFILSNFVYEYEDAAFVSTERWYSCISDAGKASNNPEYLEITYNGSSALSAGTILCIALSSGGTVDEIQVNGVASSDFSDNDNGFVNMSSSDADAIFLMQGTFSGVLTAGSAFRYLTFDGRVLGGIQSRGDFQPFSVAGNNGGERVSRIHPDLECLGLSTGVSAGEFYMYYPDWADHIGSQHYLLSQIFDIVGWMSGTGTTTANEVPTCGVTFTVTTSNTQGHWVGESNSDWFNCANWDNFSVPNEDTDVTISSETPSENCQIDITTYSATAARYGNLAQCKNLSLEGTSGTYKFIIQDSPTNKLELNGNLIITGNGKLDMTDGNGATADGTIDIYGNWDNQVGPAAFEEGNSTINFVGTTQQVISCNGLEEEFYNLDLDNVASLKLNDNTEIKGNFTFTNGTVITGTNILNVSNTSTAAIVSYSDAKYVNGNLKRAVSSTGSYDFPIGTTAEYELANINLSSTTGLSNLTASFTTPLGTTDISGLGLTVNTTPLTELLDYGFWTITPDAGTATYNVTLTSIGHTNGGSDPAQHTIVKRANSSVDWAAYQANHNNATQSGTGSSPITAKLSGMNGFSDFAIAKDDQFPLPVSFIYVKAKSLDNSVLIEWATGSEINNQSFTVERSYDLEMVEDIAIVPGMGNSSRLNEYYSKDIDPLQGISYYRIKQTDYDGTYTYSNWVTLKNIDDTELINSLYYSNESNTLKLSIKEDSEVNIRVFDVQARLILETKSSEANQNIDLGRYNLKPGIYMVSVISKTEVVTKKFYIN